MTELIIRYVKLVLYFALAWLAIWGWNSYSMRKVVGSEMEPALPRDGFKLLAPQVHRPEQLDRGDIVAFTFVRVGQKQSDFVARVIGLPGDRVKIVKGEVYLNGEKARDEFVQTSQRSNEDYEEIFVPRDTVFLLCDSRKGYVRQDSRTIGPVHFWAIEGRVR